MSAILRGAWVGAKWTALSVFALVTLYTLFVSLTGAGIGNKTSEPLLVVVAGCLLAGGGAGLGSGLMGAAVGAVVGGVRGGRVAQVPSAPQRPAVTGTTGQQAPWGMNPGVVPPSMSEATLRAIRERATNRREVATVDPVPLAPISAAPRRPTPETVDLADPERLNRVLGELDALVGLETVADQVRAMAHRIEFDRQRVEAGLPASEIGMHCVFVGPPGVAKTTVARIWGRALCALGLLKTDTVVEVDRSDLVGQHVGATAQQTAAKLREAENGVFFVDEAYALTPETPGNDFGSEAVATILKHMEDNRSTTCVIVAGYEREMDRFLESNPGLSSRFSETVRFDPYDGPTLMSIAQNMAASTSDVFTSEAVEVLRPAFVRLAAAPPKKWANGRSVRDLLSAIRTARARRLAGVALTSQAMTTLTEEDVRAVLQVRYPGTV